MTMWMRAAVLVAMVALVFGGCSASTGGGGSSKKDASSGTSGDTGADDGADVGADQGGTDQAGTDEGGTDQAGTDEGGTDEGGTGSGACTNAADQEIIGSTDVAAEARTCGLAAIGKPPGSATPCIVAATGLTEACAGCYGGTVDCTIANCIGDCAADPSGQPCSDCQVEKGCIAAFEECSGVVAGQ